MLQEQVRKDSINIKVNNNNAFENDHPGTRLHENERQSCDVRLTPKKQEA